MGAGSPGAVWLTIWRCWLSSYERTSSPERGEGNSRGARSAWLVCSRTPVLACTSSEISLGADQKGSRTMGSVPHKPPPARLSHQPGELPSDGTSARDRPIHDALARRGPCIGHSDHIGSCLATSTFRLTSVYGCKCLLGLPANIGVGIIEEISNPISRAFDLEFSEGHNGRHQDLRIL